MFVFQAHSCISLGPPEVETRQRLYGFLAEVSRLREKAVRKGKSRRLLRGGGLGATMCAPTLRYWTSTPAKAHQEHDHEDDQEDEEQNLRNPDRRTGDAGKPEQRRYKAE